MKVGIIIQARMGSIRSPGKISNQFQGEAMLEYQIKRLKNAGIYNIYIATTDQPEDRMTEEIAQTVGVPCFRGSEKDVMGRYLACSEKFEIDTIVRVGGDDPLIDPNGIFELLKIYEDTHADLIYASHSQGWIYGTAAELVTRSALKLAVSICEDPLHREHVISFLKAYPGFNGIKVIPKSKLEIRPDIYLSVDYAEDINLIDQILEYFTSIGRRYEFTQAELISLYDSGTLSIENKHLHSGF